MADWQKIETEYITTDTSYRKLSQKHGVHYQAICHKSKEGGWIAKREQFRNDTVTKTVDAIGDQTVDRATKVMNVADKLLQKIEVVVEAGDPRSMNAKSIRALTASVKDLMEVLGIRPELDRQEQQARIDKLRKDIQRDDSKTGTVTVVLEGALSDYAK